MTVEGVPAGRRVLLAIVAVAAVAIVLAMPVLITPYPGNVPWYESTALFPRASLVLVALGAVVELVRPARAPPGDDTEELDAAMSSPATAGAVVAIFLGYGLLTPVIGFLLSTALFAAAAGLAVGLRRGVALLLASGLAVALWLVFAKGLQVAFGGWL